MYIYIYIYGGLYVIRVLAVALGHKVHELLRAALEHV